MVVMRCQAVLLCCLSLASAHLCQAADDPILARHLRRPVAMAKAGGRLVVANRRSGTVTLIDRRSHRVVREIEAGRALSDVVALPGSDVVLVTDEAGHQLLGIRTGTEPGVVWRLGVPRSPVSVEVSEDGRRIVVASLWSRRMALLAVDDEGPTRRPRLVRTVDLPLAPGRVLELPGGRWLVAATFGSRLAICDPELKLPPVIRPILGINVGQMALSSNRRHILLPHQLMDAKAETTRDGVHWGGVMLNVVRTVPVASLESDPARMQSRLGLDYVGIPDRAAGDPAAIVLGHNDLRVVVLSGVHELVTSTDGIQYYGRQPLPAGPSSVVLDDRGRRAWVASRFADSVSLVSLDPLEVLETIELGPSPELQSRDRGEQLFHDARLSSDGWISCRSCHTRGHTNGGRSDTLGDGGFGAPKKVLSLLGSAQTGPWAWDGSARSLEDQVAKSVRLTMHGESLSDSQVVDITTYLRSLPPAPSLAAARQTRDLEVLKRGRSVFVRSGCISCHAPPTYTSAATYDVGLADESGRRRFNPPSLRGVSQRDAYFHDNRASSLADVIGRFRHGLDAPLTPRDCTDLLHFLESL